MAMGIRSSMKHGQRAATAQKGIGGLLLRRQQQGTQGGGCGGSLNVRVKG